MKQKTGCRTLNPTCNVKTRVQTGPQSWKSVKLQQFPSADETVWWVRLYPESFPFLHEEFKSLFTGVWRTFIQEVVGYGPFHFHPCGSGIPRP